MQSTVPINEMTFYRIGAPVGGAKYPYAACFGPLPEMPFYESYPESFTAARKEYLEVNPRPPGMLVAPGGRSWPDFIGHGGKSPFYFTSGRVIEDLRAEGIEVFRATPMPIAEIKGKAMRKITPPEYHVVEAAPGISVHWRAMGIPVDENNHMSGGYPKPWPPAEWILDGSSWNGKDLVSYHNFQFWTTLICTERVRQLAERKGWTNCEFRPLRVTDGQRLNSGGCSER